MDEFDLKIKSGGLVFLLSLVFMDLQLNTQNSSLNTQNSSLNTQNDSLRTPNSRLDLLSAISYDPSAISHPLSAIYLLRNVPWRVRHSRTMKMILFFISYAMLYACLP